MILGTEWVVDAVGCDPAILTDLGKIRAVFDRVIKDLDLHVEGEQVLHQFSLAERRECRRCFPSTSSLSPPIRSSVLQRSISTAVAIATPGHGSHARGDARCDQRKPFGSSTDSLIRKKQAMAESAECQLTTLCHFNPISSRCQRARRAR